MRTSSINSKLLIAAWLLVTILLALLLAFTMGAAMFRHVSLGGEKVSGPFKTMITTLAETPGIVKQATLALWDAITGRPSPLLINKEGVVQADWKHQFPAPSDDGYLLLSGMSAQEGQSIVQLIRIADGQVIAKWVPDWSYIHSRLGPHRWAPKGSQDAYRAMHPLLLNDGSLIFNTFTGLVRQPLCSRTPTWVLSYPYHHSIETTSNGNSVWVASVTEEFAVNHPVLKKTLRDDSLAEVSLDGRVIRNLSFSKILTDNNLTAHLLGGTGFFINDDPIHINQITPANTDGLYWKRGDLLISARHLSTIYLYRPSTGKIIWHQQGPWLNQHSAYFFKDRAITVFGNDVYAAAKVPNPFINIEKHNLVYLHDFTTGNTSKIHPESLHRLQPKTFSEGRSQVLEDMSLFIEETNNARLLKIDHQGELQWSYINTYDKEHLGAIAWSRYISKFELEKTIQPKAMKCNKFKTPPTHPSKSIY